MREGIQGQYKHVAVFRFCSPIDKEVVTGERGGVWWLNSIRYIDLDETSIINVAFTVGYVSRGSITYTDLRRMAYKEFTHARTHAQEMIKKMEDEDG
jgi:hypothetical protein